MISLIRALILIFQILKRIPTQHHALRAEVLGATGVTPENYRILIEILKILNLISCENSIYSLNPDSSTLHICKIGFCVGLVFLFKTYKMLMLIILAVLLISWFYGYTSVPYIAEDSQEAYRNMIVDGWEKVKDDFKMKVTPQIVTILSTIEKYVSSIYNSTLNDYSPSNWLNEKNDVITSKTTEDEKLVSIRKEENMSQSREIKHYLVINKSEYDNGTSLVRSINNKYKRLSAVKEIYEADYYMIEENYKIKFQKKKNEKAEHRASNIGDIADLEESEGQLDHVATIVYENP